MGDTFTNYYDDFFQSNTLDWISYLNKKYINISAPEIKVFKLDKVATPVDTLYGEEKTARIYLPPFSIRAHHLDNTWRQLLGGIIPFSEEEDNITFIVNFQEMVQTIRDLKQGRTSEISLTYGDTLIPYAQNIGDSFSLWEGDSVVATFDLTSTSYNTTSKLTTTINALSNFTATLSGDNDSSSSLVEFNKTSFQDIALLVYSENVIYQNITDIIEAGDVILTNKWRAYEVLNSNPGGDFGWSYAEHVLTCNLARLDQCDLPANYRVQIQQHQYGIKDKITME